LLYNKESAIIFNDSKIEIGSCTGQHTKSDANTWGLCEKFMRRKSAGFLHVVR
jgi:hypothetical protein